MPIKQKRQIELLNQDGTSNNEQMNDEEPSVSELDNLTKQYQNNLKIANERIHEDNIDK